MIYEKFIEPLHGKNGKGKAGGQKFNLSQKYFFRNGGKV
jgi:hypothetical protein